MNKCHLVLVRDDTFTFVFTGDRTSEQRRIVKGCCSRRDAFIPAPLAGLPNHQSRNATAGCQIVAVAQ